MPTEHNATMDEQRWDAIEHRCADAGVFFYAVKTTGIVCQAGCPSRTPRRENVVYYDSVEAAVCDGYRPCKRCRPMPVRIRSSEHRNCIADDSGSYSRSI